MVRHIRRAYPKIQRVTMLVLFALVSLIALGGCRIFVK
jgi:hypothetical protein